jgi:hypothetical protein
VYASDVSWVSVTGYVVLNLISLNACMLSMGKLGGGSGLITGIVAAEKWCSLLPTLVTANVSSYQRCGRTGRSVCGSLIKYCHIVCC